MATPFRNDVVSWLLACEDGQLEGYVSAHFDTYTGRYFEEMISHSEPQRFTPWDMLAVSALSVNVPVGAAHELVNGGELKRRANELLQQIPDTVDLGGPVALQEIAPGSPAQLLYKLVRSFPGMGPTKTSKLLAAKRPRLIPVRDSVVADLVGAGGEWWLPMRQLLIDPALSDVLDQLTTVLHSKKDPKATKLRLLDVLLWRFGKDLQCLEAARQAAEE